MNLQGRPGIKAESLPMGAMSQAGNSVRDPKAQLPTFIYDYFLKTRNPDLAAALLNTKSLHVNTKGRTKASPSGRDVNGIGDDGPQDAIAKAIEDLPVPDIIEHLPTESFLQDWFCTFWDIWWAGRNHVSTNAASQYLANANRMKNQQNMLMGGPMAARGMMRPNAPTAINPMQNAAMMNNMRRNPMVGPNQMGQQGPDGQRPQSPMTVDNAPSPKRQRLDNGGFATSSMGGAVNAGAPGQPPNFSGNIDPSQMPGFQMPGMNGVMGDDNNRLANNPQGGALADYQMQLMLLEQQNKRRLLMARQEHEVVQQTGPPGAMGQTAMMGQPMPLNVGPGRQGQSPGPAEMQKRTASQMGQSPRPDGMAGVTRGSPTPGMFENAQQGMVNPQFFQQQAQMRNGMGPNGHPGALQAPAGQMRPMGSIPGPRPAIQGQFPPGMSPYGQNPQQQPIQNPNNTAMTPQGNQPPNSMPPPQAPINQNGKPPSSPAPGPVPGTPSQKKEPAPKGKKDSTKKDAAKTKQQPKKVGATPSSEAEGQRIPTPPTPVDTLPPPSVLDKNRPNGVTQQQPPMSNGVQAQAGTQPDAMAAMDPQHMAMNPVADGNPDVAGDFGFDFSNPDTNVLDGFDFDSFLQVDGGDPGFDFSNPPFDMGGPGLEGMTENH